MIPPVEERQVQTCSDKKGYGYLPECCIHYSNGCLLINKTVYQERIDNYRKSSSEHPELCPCQYHLYPSEYRELIDQHNQQESDLILAEKCLEKWGFEPQLNVVVEELAELIQAIQKWRRYPKNDLILEHLADEIADVEFVMNTLMVLMNTVNSELFLTFLREKRKYKRDRVSFRLQKPREHNHKGVEECTK